MLKFILLFTATFCSQNSFGMESYGMPEIREIHEARDALGVSRADIERLQKIQPKDIRDVHKLHSSVYQGYEALLPNGDFMRAYYFYHGSKKETIECFRISSSKYGYVNVPICPNYFLLLKTIYKDSQNI